MNITIDTGATLTGAILAAQNEDQTKKLYIAKWDKLWRYVVSFKDQKPFLAGDTFYSKRGAIQNLAFHTQFADLDTSNILLKAKNMIISESEVVALNTAIRLLEQSNSDHTDQCTHHLTKLLEKLN